MRRKKQRERDGGQGSRWAESFGGTDAINIHTQKHTLRQGSSARHKHTNMEPHMLIHFLVSFSPTHTYTDRHTHTYTHTHPLWSLTMCFCQTPV